MYHILCRLKHREPAEYSFCLHSGNINYLHKFTMLYSKEDWILTCMYWKAMMLNKINNRVSTNWMALNYLINKMRETGTTDWQPSSGRPHTGTSRTAENTARPTSMICCSVMRMHQGHTKLPVRSPKRLTYRGGQWDASYTNTFS